MKQFSRVGNYFTNLPNFNWDSWETSSLGIPLVLHTLPDKWTLGDTVVLWSNSSCIRPKGWGFKSNQQKYLSGSQSRRKREHSQSLHQSEQQQSEKKRRQEEKEKEVEASFEASILCGGAIWHLCNINKVIVEKYRS